MTEEPADHGAPRRDQLVVIARNSDEAGGRRVPGDDGGVSGRIELADHRLERVGASAEHQIVKYTFDNVWMDFLPVAWLVRVDDIRASMTMGQPFPDVWLPNIEHPDE